MSGFFGSALRLWFRPSAALRELADDDASVVAAALLVVISAAVSAGLVGFFAATGIPFAVGFGVALAVAPWLYGALLGVLLRVLGSVTVTLGGTVRISCALTAAMPVVVALQLGAARIGPGIALFVGFVLPLVGLIGLSAFAALTVFETSRNPTWLAFGAVGIATFCWGSCASETSHDALYPSAPIVSAQEPSPAVAPRSRPAPAQRPAPPPPKPGWTVRVNSVPPGAVVTAAGRLVGPAPIDVTVAGDAPSVVLTLALEGVEKRITATPAQAEVVVVMPPPPRLRFDGLYSAVRGKQIEWLRFNAGGDVSTAELAREVPAARAVKALKKGAHYHLEGQALSFTLRSKRAARPYVGTVGADRLSLKTTGDAAPIDYGFVAP